MAFTTAFYIDLNGITQDLILNFFEDDLIFRIVKIGFMNGLTEFVSQIFRYKQDKEFEILCLVTTLKPCYRLHVRNM